MKPFRAPLHSAGDGCAVPARACGAPAVRVALHSIVDGRAVLLSLCCTPAISRLPCWWPCSVLARSLPVLPLPVLRLSATSVGAAPLALLVRDGVPLWSVLGLRVNNSHAVGPVGSPFRVHGLPCLSLFLVSALHLSLHLILSRSCELALLLIVTVCSLGLAPRFSVNAASCLSSTLSSSLSQSGFLSLHPVVSSN